MKRSFVSLMALGIALGVAVPATLATSAQAATPGPVALAPDDASTYQKDLVMTWDEVSGATGYEVQITGDGFGTDGYVFEDEAATNRYVVPVDLPRGDYLWRVRATLPGDTSDWSSAADLVRGWDPSVTPVLSHLGADNFDWSVSWTPVPGAAFYEVELSKRGDEPEDETPFSKSDTITCFTTHTTFTTSKLERGEASTVGGDTCSGELDAAETYSIRVRGRDGSVDTRSAGFPEPANSCTGAWQAALGEGWTGVVPECSGWSADIPDLVLNTSFNEPSKVTGLGTDDPNSSCDAADACSDAPVMTWNQDVDAAYYRVYVSRDRSMTDSDLLYDNVVGTHFQMTGALADRQLPWYWRVQACNLLDPADDPTNDAKCGPASDISSFTVSNRALKLSGAAPTDIDPDVKQQYVDFTVPNEILQADHQADAFRIQVSTKSDFSAVVKTDTVDQQAGDATVTTYRWENVDDGDYFWRYRAVDATGQLSPWTQNSDLRFTVNAAIPQVRIDTKSGWGLGDSIQLKAEKALSGVTSNTLGVQLKGGAQVEGKITAVNSTTWKFTPEGRWIPNAAYVPYVEASVTAPNGKSAVGDDVVHRPSGMADSKSGAVKKVDGDFDWKTLSASGAVGKSYVATKHAKASSKVPYVSVKFGGTKVTLVACKSSISGLADIYLDGTKVKSVDLYRASSSCGEVWSKTGLTDGLHTLEVKVTGKKSSKSGGTYVGVDAVKAG